MSVPMPVFARHKEGHMTTQGVHQPPIRDRVELTATSVRIASLEIPIKAMVNYLQTIPSARRELALVHAIDVGITEILARRARFQHGVGAAERRTVASPPQATGGQAPLARQPEAGDHLLEPPAQPLGTQSSDEFLARLDEAIQTDFAGRPRPTE
jgi:hypothetical protein